MAHNSRLFSMVSYFPGSNLRRNLTLSLRPLPPPLYMRTMRRPRRTERTRLPSALYAVNSWPLSLDLNVARMEKSYGNPSKGCKLQTHTFPVVSILLGNAVAVGTDITAFLVSLKATSACGWPSRVWQ